MQAQIPQHQSLPEDVLRSIGNPVQKLPVKGDSLFDIFSLGRTGLSLQKPLSNLLGWPEVHRLQTGNERFGELVTDIPAETVLKGFKG